MHIPALPKETIALLQPSINKVFVDCTLGFGGHTKELLALGASVIGIDQDQAALDQVKAKFPGNTNITYIKNNFSNIKNIIKEPVDGFLFDLGVSSYQIDEAIRGFSLRLDGPLDMRMDQSKNKTAADIVNGSSSEELEKIFFGYGEERFSKRIVRRILEERGKKPIETTFELKEIIEKAIPTWKKRESATRIFQALRIAVNMELDNLQVALKDCVPLLKLGGRIAVISYHSLEDRIVKRFFVEQKSNGILKIITKKPVVAGEEELVQNPRAKSAKLRVAEKI